MLHPPAHPAEQSCVGVGTRTHSGIVVMHNKPRWVISLAQKGMGKGWTRRPVIQRASRSTPVVYLGRGAKKPEAVPSILKEQPRLSDLPA